MIESAKKKLDQNPILADFFNALLFGVLSVLFGYVKIRVPNFEGISADFREIPLLISIFYIRSWWPIIVMCGITLFTPSLVHPVTVYFMHFFGLIFVWAVYHMFFSRIPTDRMRALNWAMTSLVYYSLFIIPLLILFNQWLDPIEDLIFTAYYVDILGLIKYELIVTTLVTTMYLVQFDARNQLLKHERTLEIQVEDRTNKLASANHRLQVMNENLDDMVIKRSRKIKEQLRAIEKYVNMNSHQLRAPLSNILGLVELLKDRVDENNEHLLLIESLDDEASKLDEIVKEMNELLENEMKFHSYNVEE